MTAPHRQPSPPSVFTPLSEGALKTVRESPEVQDALRREQSELQREVILWQRWIRYLALLVLCGAAVLLSDEPVPVIPLLSVAIGYALCVVATGVAVQRVSGLTSGAWLPALLLTADLITIGTIIFITNPPVLSYRFLILALLSVQLAAFYFGAGLGAYATLLSAAIYGLVAHVLPTVGTPISPWSSALNVSLFALVAGVLTYTFGRFRARLNQLRLFCKVIEEGDLMTGIGLTSTKRPDELTLLARSFDAMRNGLASQIGTDALTACLNRRALEARLRADWRLAKRRGTHLAVLAIDIDHFKQINDSRGHPIGDVVLQQLAGVMKATARDSDAVSRFGGDEFVLLLPDTGWQGALTFAERLRRRVDDFTFGPPGSPMAVTVSIGVSLARGTDDISPEELLKEADRSLYKAKQQGRNRVFA